MTADQLDHLKTALADVVEVELERVGALRNTVVAAVSKR